MNFILTKTFGLFCLSFAINATKSYVSTKNISPTRLISNFHMKKVWEVQSNFDLYKC